MTPRVSRILVIKHGAFGDIIQADGAVADLRRQHREAELVVLTTPPYRRLYERCPSVDRVLIDARPPRWRIDLMADLRRRLRRERFDQVYDLQTSTRTAFYRRWLLPDVPWSGRMRRRTWRLRAAPQTVPSLERLAAQLHEAGIPVQHTTTPNLSWMADDVSTILDDAGVRDPFVVLIPGSSARHPGKRWPFYPGLARALEARNFTVVSAPGPGEQDLAHSLGGTVLTGSRGVLDWFELAGLFRRAAFVVGNDTGPTHLASHVGAPGLALFGRHVAPVMTGIRRDTFEALAVPDLEALPVADVLAAIARRLPGFSCAT